MPFILVGLGDLFFGTLAGLCAIAGIIIIQAIADLIPDIGIPHTSINIRTIFQDVSGGFVGYIVNWTKPYWTRVGAWFRAHIWMMGGLFGEIISVFEHHAAQIAQLNNTTIPGAQNAAIAASIAHDTVVANGLQNNIDHATSVAAAATADLRNYVNGPFQTSLDQAINNAESGAEAAAHAELAQVESTLASQIQNLGLALDQLDQIATYTIPAEIAAAQQAAEDQAHSELVTNVQALQAQLTNLQAQIVANAQAEQAALASAEAAIAKQQAADLNTAEGVAAADTAAAEASASMALAAQAAQQSAALQSQANAVAATLDTITAQQQIEESNTTALQQVTSVAIPATIAAVGAAVVSITTEFERCAVTTCAGPNNITGLLNGLLGGAEFGAVLAFIADAAKDPAGAAKNFAGGAEDLFSEGHSLITSLLSL